VHKIYIGIIITLLIISALLGYGYFNASRETSTIKSDLESIRATNKNLTRLVAEQGFIIERARADNSKLETNNKRLEETNKRLREYQTIDAGAIGAIQQLIGKGRKVTNSLTEKNTLDKN
jgi:hypothetical protein